MADPGGDFYVGYRPAAPAGLGRWLRRVVAAIVLGGAAVAGALASLQAPFADATFEYGTVRDFEGSLRADPYPALEVVAPADRAGRTHLLVDRGKHGAGEDVVDLAGRAVRVAGQLVERESMAMVELTTKPVEQGPAAPGPVERSFGQRRLRGEIVDTKCHLGVMKPGEGKVHRACAARCISGGIPPALWVRDRAGRSRRYLLQGTDGGALGGPEVLARVAEPVEVVGEVVRRGDLWLLRTDAARIRRIGRGGD
jgi:hypothetical protein